MVVEVSGQDPAEDGASDVIISAGAEQRPTEAIELLGAEAGQVRANVVTMERAGAERVTAERAILNNSGARTIEARSAQIDHSGILGVKTEKVVLSQSTAIGIAAGEARIVRGTTVLLKTEAVTFEGDPRILVYAGPPSADVRPSVDAWGAMAFGAGIGAAFVVLGAIARRIFQPRGR